MNDALVVHGISIGCKAKFAMLRIFFHGLGGFIFAIVVAWVAGQRMDTVL